MAEMRADGWGNVITGLGMSVRDKRMASQVQPAVSLTPQQLDDLFAGDPLARRICQLPPREQTRKWLKITCDKEELAKKHMQRQQELGVQSSVFKAMVWARLYGGSVLLLGVDDGAGRDLAEPLNEANIRTFKWMNVIERRHIEVATLYGDEFGPKLGEPQTYRLNGTSIVDVSGKKYGREIHESRVIRFDGVLTPLDRISQNNGWCDSIFVSLLHAIRDTWGGFDGAAALLQDFAQAVYKMNGLAGAMGQGQDSLVLARLKQVDMVRSLMRAVVIDKDEEFTRVATPVTGMPELLDRLEQLLSAVTGIPATKLWGRSPAGMNATGESDTRNWYDEQSSEQETELRPKLERLFRLMWLAKDGPSGGAQPDSWEFAFNPLWQLTAKEQSDVRKVTAEADAIEITSGVIHPEEVRQSRYGGGTYSTTLTLDPDFDDPETRMPEETEDPEASEDPEKEPLVVDDDDVEE